MPGILVGRGRRGASGGGTGNFLFLRIHP